MPRYQEGHWGPERSIRGSNVTENMVRRATELEDRLKIFIETWAEVQPDILTVEFQLTFDWVPPKAN